MDGGDDDWLTKNHYGVLRRKRKKVRCPTPVMRMRGSIGSPIGGRESRGGVRRPEGAGPAGARCATRPLVGQHESRGSG